jgi:hypothetical protein
MSEHPPRQPEVDGNAARAFDPDHLSTPDYRIAANDGDFTPNESLDPERSPTASVTELARYRETRNLAESVYDLDSEAIKQQFESELGISAEELAHIEGFSELSTDKQALVLAQLKQNLVTEAEIDSIQNFNALQNETNQIQNFWGKMSKKIWLGLSKEYQKAKFRKEAVAEMTDVSTDHSTQLQTMVDIVKRTPDVRRETIDGEATFVVDYVGEKDFLGTELTDADRQTIESFNTVARSFSQLPYEYKYGTTEQQEAYTATKEQYDNLKTVILDIKRRSALNRQGPDTAKDTMHEVVDSETLRFANELDQSLTLNQFLESNPQLEQELLLIKEQGPLRRALRKMVSLNGPGSSNLSLMAAGGIMRASAVSLLSVSTLAAAPVVGGLVGGARGYLNARQELTDAELLTRSGEQSGGTDKVDSNEAFTFSSAKKLIARLDKEIRLITGEEKEDEDSETESKQDEDNETEELKRDPSYLLSRIAFTEGKIRSGQVSYEEYPNEREGQLDLLRTLMEARELLELHKPEQDKQVEERLDRFQGYRHNKAEGVRRSHKVKGAIHGAAIGGAFAAAGAAIVQYGSHFMDAIFGSRAEAAVITAAETPPTSSPDGIPSNLPIANTTTEQPNYPTPTEAAEVTRQAMAQVQTAFERPEIQSVFKEYGILDPTTQKAQLAQLLVKFMTENLGSNQDFKPNPETVAAFLEAKAPLPDTEPRLAAVIAPEPPAVTPLDITSPTDAAEVTRQAMAQVQTAFERPEIQSVFKEYGILDPTTQKAQLAQLLVKFMTENLGSNQDFKPNPETLAAFLEAKAPTDPITPVDVTHPAPESPTPLSQASSEAAPQEASPATTESQTALNEITDKIAIENIFTGVSRLSEADMNALAAEWENIRGTSVTALYDTAARSTDYPDTPPGTLNHLRLLLEDFTKTGNAPANATDILEEAKARQMSIEDTVKKLTETTPQQPSDVPAAAAETASGPDTTYELTKNPDGSASLAPFLKALDNISPHTLEAIRATTIGTALEGQPDAAIINCVALELRDAAIKEIGEAPLPENIEISQDDIISAIADTRERYVIAQAEAEKAAAKVAAEADNTTPQDTPSLKPTQQLPPEPGTNEFERLVNFAELDGDIPGQNIDILVEAGVDSRSIEFSINDLQNIFTSTTLGQRLGFGATEQVMVNWPWAAQIDFNDLFHTDQLPQLFGGAAHQVHVAGHEEVLLTMPRELHDATVGIFKQLFAEYDDAKHTATELILTAKDEHWPLHRLFHELHAGAELEPAKDVVAGAEGGDLDPVDTGADTPPEGDSSSDTATENADAERTPLEIPASINNLPITTDDLRPYWSGDYIESVTSKVDASILKGDWEEVVKTLTRIHAGETGLSSAPYLEYQLAYAELVRGNQAAAAEWARKALESIAAVDANPSYSIGTNEFTADDLKGAIDKIISAAEAKESVAPNTDTVDTGADTPPERDPSNDTATEIAQANSTPNNTTPGTKVSDTPTPEPHPVAPKSPAMQHTEQLLSDLNEHPDYKVNSGDELYKIINQKLSAHTDSFGKLDADAQAAINEIVRARLRTLDQAELKAFGLREVNGVYDIDKIWPGDRLDFRVLLDDTTMDKVRAVTEVSAAPTAPPSPEAAQYDIYEKVEEGDRLSDYIKVYAEGADEIGAVRQKFGEDNVFHALVDHAIKAEEKILDSWGVESGNAAVIHPGDTIHINYDPDEVQKIVEEYVAHKESSATEAVKEAVTDTKDTAPINETAPKAANTDPTSSSALKSETLNATPPPETTTINDDFEGIGGTEYAIDDKHRAASEAMLKELASKTYNVTEDWKYIKDETVAEVFKRTQEPFDVFGTDSDLTLLNDRPHGIDSEKAVRATQAEVARLRMFTGLSEHEGETVADFYKRAMAYDIARGEKLNVFPDINTKTGKIAEPFFDARDKISFHKRVMLAAQASGLDPKDYRTDHQFLEAAIKRLHDK